jgi:hypothetical protein
MDNKAIAERDRRRDAPVQGALPWPIVAERLIRAWRWHSCRHERRPVKTALLVTDRIEF